MHAPLRRNRWPLPLLGMALAMACSAAAAAAQEPPIAPPPAAPPAVEPGAAQRCVAKPQSFGCANSANLAAMADPADLAMGRPLSPSPGALEANAIDRLLTDKVKDLRREGTEGAGGGPQ